jgi:hypothetical protein
MRSGYRAYHQIGALARAQLWQCRKDGYPSPFRKPVSRPSIERGKDRPC